MNRCWMFCWTVLSFVALPMAGCSGHSACSFNSQCAVGQFCSAGACTSECHTAADCVASHGAGSTCSGFGMCVGGADAAPSDTGTPSPDASSNDASAMDAATFDAGALDAGRMDAGPMDAGPTDTGSDANVIDMAIADMGVDTALVDAALVDAGRDMGPPDSGGSLIDSGPPPPGTLLFSEYIEGSSSNKAIEIYNASAVTVDLTMCMVREYANGSTAPTSYTLAGTLAPRAVLTLCNMAGMMLPSASCSIRTGNAVTNFNGNDAVELVCAGVTLDVIGQIGTAPTLEWGTGLTSTMDNTLRRHCSVTTGDTNGTDAFDPAVEWDGFAVDTFDDLGVRVCP